MSNARRNKNGNPCKKQRRSNSLYFHLTNCMTCYWQGFAFLPAGLAAGRVNGACPIVGKALLFLFVLRCKDTFFRRKFAVQTKNFRRKIQRKKAVFARKTALVRESDYKS